MVIAASPVADQIAFNARGRGGSDIYILDLQTGRVRAVTQSTQYEEAPAFSTDGQWLAYTASAGPGSEPGIRLVRTDGTDGRALTAAGVAYDEWPRYAPGGDQVVFARAGRSRPYSMGGTTWDQWDLYEVPTEGGSPTQLTREQYYQVNGLAVLPGHQGIIMAAAPNVAGTQCDLFRVSLDGASRPRQLTTEGRSYFPSLGQNGEEVLFTTTTSDWVDHLGVLHLADETVERVADAPGYTTWPCSSPDGAKIRFLSGSDRVELWEVGRDGTGLRRLRNSRFFDDPLGAAESGESGESGIRGRYPGNPGTLP